MTRPAPLRRHLLLLVLLSSIPAFALVAFNSWQEYARLRDTATERAMAAANSIVREQRVLIAQTRELLAALGSLPEIATGDFKACSKQLREFIRLSGAYENFGVFAPDGAMVCSAKPLSHTVNVADMPYFRRTLETRAFVVGEYHLSRSVDRPVFTMSAPIFDARGEPAGIILAAVSTDWFEQEAKAIGLPYRHMLTVLDSAFNVIARHPGDEWIGRNVADSPLAARLRAASTEGTAEIAGLSGEPRFVAYVPLQADQGGNRVFVVIGARIDELYREPRITLIQNLIGLLFAVSVVAAGAWFQADRLVLRHVHTLIRAIEKLKSGQTETRVVTDRGSRELVVLGQAFNDMAVALHDREAALAEAQRLAQVGSWEWTIGIDTVNWSKELYRIYGRDPKLPAPKDEELDRIYPPASRKRLEAALHNARQTGAGYECEVQILRPDGSRRWITARGEAVRDASGRVVKIHGTAQDITERKRAEEAILQAQLRYQTLFEQSPVGIVVIDLDTGLAVDCNALAHNELGYSKEEFLRLRVSDYEALESPEDIKAHTQKITRLGMDQFETQHRTKNGERRDVNVIVRVLEFGERRYLYGIYQDVTERKTAAIALQRANRALRTLSAANEELVRATSETELLQRVCRAIVEGGSFSAASVGYAQNDPEKGIKPMAWAGVNESYISEHIQTWAETEMGQRPISKTIRSGKPEVARNILADPAFAHWKDDAIKYGFASNIALPLSDAAGTIGALNIYASEPDAFDSEEIHLLVELANDLSYGITTLRTRAERDRIAHAHAHHEETLRKSLEDSIQAISSTVEMRDPYTAGHQRRVSELAGAIAAEMGLPEDKIHGIRLAASVHDLGKINVPAEILAKPGKLSAIEFMLMKTHAQAGYDILKDIEFPWPIATMVWQHHERLDGSGYPQGLKGGEILLESRIMAVADVVEAMASHRPYRPALGIEVALSEIERGRGTAYEPAAVDACLRLFREGRFAFGN